MSFPSKLENLQALVGGLLRHPLQSLNHLRHLPGTIRAARLCQGWARPAAGQSPPVTVDAGGNEGVDNPLWNYFLAHKEGHGIWKWDHYFNIYNRHLARFIGSDVHLAEVGVYSGGSLPMWRQYLGPKSHVTGIDIEEACKTYEGPGVSIHIGDQADRSFWKRFREQSSPVDVLIDDGGHLPEQQIVTLEEMLPWIRPGGVYICEDIHGIDHRFVAFVSALADKLNHYAVDPTPGPEEQGSLIPSPFQQSIESIHFYPFIIVVEKHAKAIDHFRLRRRGTEWQPFKL